VIDRLVDGIDERTGGMRLVRRSLRYVFPDHWSFLLGEIALYSFVVLVATGIYLAFFFEPSLDRAPYAGAYRPLHDVDVSHAYGSALDLSFHVKAGLLMRQTHHWAALVFVAAILCHLLRILLTGAYRNPREINHILGAALLATAILEGFLGYSLPDDLLSGMGLAIAYSVALSVPLIGDRLAPLIWGGQYPGSGVIEPRMYIVHVLIIPLLLAGLIAVHLTLVALLKHTQFAGPRRTERNVIGTRLWPGYALRSLGLLAVVAGVLLLLGGLVQINPIWQYGPYDLAAGSNGVQPDWYMGWLIGALRLMPPVEPTILGITIPNPFFGGVLFPAVAFGILFAWPFLDRLLSADSRPHHLLDRPRDAPSRTAAALGFATWVIVPFITGASDRIFVTFDIGYELQVTIMRVAWVVLPAVVFLLTLHVCRRLRARGQRPLRGWDGTVVERAETGGFRAAGGGD
jgi:ubiquinol-cytochrome c reductase cytochrome b subunit